MNIAIIGSEERKFTAETEAEAKRAISTIIQEYASSPPTIISGGCHLGGVDIWAEEAADRIPLPKMIFKPNVHKWDGEGLIGYKQRNERIAQEADIVYVIVVAHLPPGYVTEPWNRKPCYHCAKRKHQIPTHVKSGACWSAWLAVEQYKKEGKWIVI